MRKNSRTTRNLRMKRNLKQKKNPNRKMMTMSFGKWKMGEVENEPVVDGDNRQREPSLVFAWVPDYDVESMELEGPEVEDSDGEGPQRVLV